MPGAQKAKPEARNIKAVKNKTGPKYESDGAKSLLSSSMPGRRSGYLRPPSGEFLRRKPGNQGNYMEQEALTGEIIGAAICVHRELGPVFLETIYEEALCVELASSGLMFARQVAIEIQ
ncbi:MAG TPA: GxxExxY protein, partial [Opitutaceae bacterium]|nr:GxxExxY protein [Opitutaceae bacterium]